ncbi:MAG: hypothetical protein ACYTFK_05640 [Planctomycetota bacterium]|jgi:hypothetical protein
MTGKSKFIGRKPLKDRGIEQVLKKNNISVDILSIIDNNPVRPRGHYRGS